MTRQAVARPPGRIQIGRVVGVPVYLTPSWFLFAAFIVVTSAPPLVDRVGTVSAYIAATSFAVLLLVSVLLHEVGHCLVARAFDLPVRSITVTLLAGLTEITEPPQTPAREYAVAVSGPMVSLLLAGIGVASVPLFEGLPQLICEGIAITNGIVAAFNLLPGLPLDGGFLVDSLVWRLTGSRESGLIAAGWCGRVVTVLVVLGLVGRPILNGQPPDLFILVWALFIGAFLWVGATNAIRSGRGGRLLAGIRIDSVWRRAASLSARASAAQALDLRVSGPGGTAVVVEDDLGNPIGLLDDDSLRAIPEQSRASVSVTSVMLRQPDGWVVEATPDQSIATVVGAMQRLGIGAVPVRGPNGRIDGIVLATDLEAALSRGSAQRT